MPLWGWALCLVGSMVAGGVVGVLLVIGMIKVFFSELLKGG